MRRVLLFAFGFVFAGLTAACFLIPTSQSSESRIIRFLPMLGNDVVLHMMAIAGAAQSDGDPLARNLITFEEARRIVDLAAASASAAWCGVEVTPAALRSRLAVERNNSPRSPEALAYAVKLHQVAMEMFERDLRATSVCPDGHKREVKQFLAGSLRPVSVALDTSAAENGTVRP
jgi:hypothetical protein